MFATVYFSLSVGLFLSTFINTWKNQESLFVTCMVYQRSTLNSAVLFNLPICLTWLIMRVASRLISGHTVDDDYDRLLSRLKARAIVVLLIILTYRQELDFILFVGLSLQFLHYIANQYLSLRSNHLFLSPDPHIKTYLRVLIPYTVLVFVGWQVMSKYNHTKQKDKELQSRFVHAISYTFYHNIPSFLSLVMSTYSAATHYQFDYLRRKWYVLTYIFDFSKFLRFLFYILKAVSQSQDRLILLLQALQIGLHYKFQTQKFEEQKKIRSQIQKIPLVEETEICTVCLREVKIGRKLPCRHIFHDDCLRMWVERNHKKNCPKCSQSYLIAGNEPQITKPTTKEVQDNSKYLQIARKKRHLTKEQALRIGSTSFGLPAQAVYRRTMEDIALRQRFQSTN